MEIVLYLLHIAVCVVLILVVLLQSGKAADLAGAFGGGGSQTALGSRGAATVLTKATTICAILFMVTSLGLALYASRQGGSVLEQVPATSPEIDTTPEATAPVEPAAAAVPETGDPTPEPGRAPADGAQRGQAAEPGKN